jgi:ribosomal protein S18 acetylase RimI-like enzyme
MSDLRFVLVDADNFDDIPDPAAPGARCQTCDYWERLDGHREKPEAGATGAQALKRSRLLSGERLAGSYAVLAYDGDAAVGYAQFGPLSNYPRAQAIRDRYPMLPDSPAPWVITCLQVVPHASDRNGLGEQLLDATCQEIDRRGITAVEAYPEGVPDGWLPSPGPTALYEANAFARVAGDDRFPVYRRELTGEGEGAGWDDLLRHTAPADDEDDWPFALPSPRDDDDLFRLPERPRRPNPFGDD